MAQVTENTVEEVIANNNYSSISHIESTEANTFKNNPSITMTGTDGRLIMNAFTLVDKNIPSVLEVGYTGYKHEEWNIGNTSNDMAIAAEAFFLKYQTKTYYANRWFSIKTIQKDLMKSSDPAGLLNDFLAKDAFQYYNSVMCATLAGMKDIEEITVGDGTKNFSQSLVLEAEGIRGDAGYKGFNRFYMHSDTLKDILKKQDGIDINKALIQPIKIGEQATINVASGTAGTTIGQSIQTRMGGLSTMAYLGSVPIILDDELEKGIISILGDGAFAFAVAEKNDPIAYERIGKTGNGSGKEEFGMRVTFIMHPVGFNFTGVESTETGAGKYAEKTGLSLAELKAGGQYQAGYDIKQTKIIQIKVKMGTS